MKGDFGSQAHKPQNNRATHVQHAHKHDGAKRRGKRLVRPCLTKSSLREAEESTCRIHEASVYLRISCRVFSNSSASNCSVCTFSLVGRKCRSASCKSPCAATKDQKRAQIQVGQGETSRKERKRQG